MVTNEKLMFVEMRSVWQFSVFGGPDDGLQMFQICLCDGSETGRMLFFTVEEASKLAKLLLDWLPETDSDGLAWELHSDPDFCESEGETRRVPLEGWPTVVKSVGQALVTGEDSPHLALFLFVKGAAPEIQNYVIPQLSAEHMLIGLLRGLSRCGLRLQASDEFAEATDDE